MSVNRVEEAEVDRLGAAVFEQRRLSHMLRRRGAEIDALTAERERLAERAGDAVARQEELESRIEDAERRRGELDREAESLRAVREQLETESSQAREAAEAAAGELEQEREVARAEVEQAREELGRAEYEARRAERRQAKAEGEAAAALRRAEGHEREEREQIAGLVADREQVASRLAEAARERDELREALEQAREETRLAAHRVATVEWEAAKAEREMAEAQRRHRLQLDSLAAELRAGLASRDEALGASEKVAAERDEALATLPEIERDARELGRAEIEVERLIAAEREREVALAESDTALARVGEHLRDIERSRSWRWGQGLSRAFRLLTLRRRSRRSALDVALERLDGIEEQTGDERRAH